MHNTTTQGTIDCICKLRGSCIQKQQPNIKKAKQQNTTPQDQRAASSTTSLQLKQCAEVNKGHFRRVSGCCCRILNKSLSLTKRKENKKVVFWLEVPDMLLML